MIRFRFIFMTNTERAIARCAPAQIAGIVSTCGGIVNVIINQ